jgi:TPP-dependent pyruvate/acetoin dehydrogenase alpha subunit
MTTATETKTHPTTQAKIEQAVGMYSKMLAICPFEEQVNDLYTRRPNAGTGALCMGAKERWRWESVRRFDQTNITSSHRGPLRHILRMSK